MNSINVLIPSNKNHVYFDFPSIIFFSVSPCSILLFTTYDIKDFMWQDVLGLALLYSLVEQENP